MISFQSVKQLNYLDIVMFLNIKFETYMKIFVNIAGSKTQQFFIFYSVEKNKIDMDGIGETINHFSLALTKGLRHIGSFGMTSGTDDFAKGQGHVLDSDFVLFDLILRV